MHAATRTVFARLAHSTASRQFGAASGGMPAAASRSPATVLSKSLAASDALRRSTVQKCLFDWLITTNGIQIKSMAGQGRVGYLTPGYEITHVTCLAALAVPVASGAQRSLQTLRVHVAHTLDFTLMRSRRMRQRQCRQMAELTHKLNLVTIMHQSAASAKSNAEAALGRSRDVSPPRTHLLHT